jgi:hypothetical protein
MTARTCLTDERLEEHMQIAVTGITPDFERFVEQISAKYLTNH